MVLGVGLVPAAMVFWAKDVSVVVNLARGLFMVACGITCPLAVLPGWLQRVDARLPMTYALEAVRGGPCAIDLVRLLAIMAAALAAAGAAVFWAVERHVRRVGTLTLH